MKRLIVCVPGLDGSTTSWNPLLDRLYQEKSLERPVISRFNHGLHFFSKRRAEDQASELLAHIDGEWALEESRGSPYEDILLLGHSVGALLVRRAYLTALGDANRGEPRRPWVDKVTRVVLFAGVNRGLFSSVDIDEKTHYRTLRKLLRRFIELLPGHFFVADLLAGSDFVTDVRLSWIRTFSRLEHPPALVQVLGAADKLVEEKDSVDVAQFPSGHHIKLAKATHTGVVIVETDDGFLEKRYAQIRSALLDRFEKPMSPSKSEGSTIIFVVHGIKASNRGWVKQATQILEKKLPSAIVVPATYWHFSPLQFMLTPVRKRRTLWFKQCYSYFLSRDPNATFHFLGHSNGTYLLGASLKRIASMKFGKVILAGSVLPKEFDWASRVGKHREDLQVKELWNHRAQRDVPVAILCSALRGLGMKDVGTGGYDGFDSLPEIHECFYHRGGHSAPLSKTMLPKVVEQLVEDKPMPYCDQLTEEAGWFSWLSHVSPLLALVIIGLIAVLAYGAGSAAKVWLAGHGFDATLWEARTIVVIVEFAVLCLFLHLL